jgi:transposase
MSLIGIFYNRHALIKVLRQLWSWTEKKTATWFIQSWIAMTRDSGINVLEKFATTLEEHLEGILAYFDFDGLSIGPLEGTNNTIKTMQRKRNILLLFGFCAEMAWIQQHGIL